MSLYIKAKQKREKRANLWQNMKTLHRRSKDSGKGFTPEQRATWDRMDDDVVGLTNDIEKIEAEISVSERRGQQRSAGGARPDGNGGSFGQADKAKRQAAFRAWAAGGEQGMTAEQRSIMKVGQINEPGNPHNGRQGLTIRAQSVGTATAGGHTVAEDFSATLEDSMLAFGGMRRVATILNTSNGADLPVPTSNDTGTTGELLGENSQAAAADVVFGAVTLQSFMYSSKVVLVSQQLLTDSAFNLEQYLARKLGERIGRIQNTQFTVGDGSSKPNGLVTGASSGKTAASATVFTVAELLDLKHSVDPAYRGQGQDSPQPGGVDDVARWMFNDTTLKALKQLTVGSSDDRPLWQPSHIVGEPDRIDGDRFVINQDMATAATGTKPIIYGDFSKYWIRDVSGVTLLRLVERYADYLQVGFLAFHRADGDLIDAGTDPCKYLTMG
jgi:HK97 family phage major capsid protein